MQAGDGAVSLYRDSRQPGGRLAREQGKLPRPEELLASVQTASSFLPVLSEWLTG